MDAKGVNMKAEWLEGPEAVRQQARVLQAPLSEF
jgi:hypothetical protein